MLEALKRTIARVELDGKPNGTAFLVDRKHVATALHVLDRRSTVDLVFVEWSGGDRKRVATRIWRHPAYDLAILKLDRECPSGVQPLPWATTPATGDRWSTFGFPAQVPDGHPLVDERINDPSLLIDDLELRILHLHTLQAHYDLGGFSGAPCAVDGAIVGVIADQLRRKPSGGTEQTVREPSLHTLYALPITLLARSGIVPPKELRAHARSLQGDDRAGWCEPSAGTQEPVEAAFRQGVAAIRTEVLPDAERPRLKVRRGVDPTGLVLADPAAAMPSAAVGRILATQSSLHAQRTQRGQYVRRIPAEESVFAAIRDGRPWVSIVGDAGTGKSTLLHHLLGAWLADAQAGSGPVPLFVDAQTLTGALAESPLAEFGLDLGLLSPWAWDALLELGDLVGEGGRRLLVLLDTLDASLIRDRGRARTLAWLKDDARRHNVQVVTTCRSMEAATLLPAGRRYEVRLGDYTLEEAAAAIGSYLAAYYADDPPAVQMNVQLVSLRYLQTASIRPLCTRPITLRMIFDAHRGTHLPEKLNRTQLFRAYWESRVAGERVDEGTTYARRSSPGERGALALAVADRMRQHRMFSLAGLEFEVLAADRADARLDLLSERVLQPQDARRSHYEFFHQSFLEYAAAKAVLHALGRGSPAPFEEEIGRLGREGMQPWYELLEELAIQASSLGATEPVGIIARRLLALGTHEALDSLALIWTQLTDASGLDDITEAIRNDRHARATCLHFIHNASPARIGDILEQIALASWRAPRMADRLAALKAVSVAASLAPAATKVFAETHIVELIQGKSVGDDARNLGQLLGGVIEVIAAFLGADDGFAECYLTALHRLVAGRHNRTLLANLVAAVAARQDVSPGIARSLLRRWFEEAPMERQRQGGRLQDAFVQTLAPWPEIRRDVAQQRQNMIQSEQLRRRWLPIWREFCLREPTFAEQELAPLYEGSLDRDLVACIDAIILHPLAERRAPGILGLLMRAATYAADADNAASLRRKLALQALRCYADDPGHAREIAAVLGERLARGRTHEERVLATQVSHFLEPSIVELLAELAASDSAAANTIALGLPPDPPARLAEAVLAAVWASASAALAAQVASSAPRMISSLRRELRDEFCEWLLQSCGERRTSAVRNAALEALAPVMRAHAGPDRSAAVIAALLLMWERASDDAIGQRIGNTLADLLDGAAIDAEVGNAVDAQAHALLTRVPTDEEVARRRASGRFPANQVRRRREASPDWSTTRDAAADTLLQERWRETHRSAIKVLTVLWRSDPDRLAEALERLLAHFGEVITPLTDDLAGMASATHFVAAGDPLRAWRLARRMSGLGHEIGLNVAGWRSVASALSSALRSAFDHPVARAEVMDALGTFDEWMQYEIVRIGYSRGDIDFRDRIAGFAQRLRGRARDLHKRWMKSRLLDLDEQDEEGAPVYAEDADDISHLEHGDRAPMVRVDSGFKSLFGPGGVRPESDTSLPLFPDLVEGIERRWSFRIREFLNEYLSVPFGGRGDEWKELDEWLADETTRLGMIVADAGRGKSALLARWTHHVAQTNRADVVFMPISLRFQTARGNDAARIIARRLVHLLPPSTRAVPPDDPAEVLQECKEMFRAPWAGFRPLLIVIDGLDETIDWRCEQLIPSVAGENVKLLVAARRISTGHDDWEQRLCWSGCEQFTLRNLKPDAVAEIVRSADEFRAVADNSSLMVRFHALTEGDPLIVQLQLGLLRQSNQGSPLERMERLLQESPPAGEPLKQFFDRWWSEQLVQWDLSEAERTRVQDVFDALAYAKGPLGLTDLRALTGTDPEALRRTLKQLGRFVIVDRTAGRYVFSHSRLQAYFADKLLEAGEGAQWRRRFVEYGAACIAELEIAPTVERQGEFDRRFGYVLRHHALHLVETAPEGLLKLVSLPWLKGWRALESDDGDYGGFYEDVSRVERWLREVRASEDRSPEARFTGEQVRALLVKTSISSLSSNVPPWLVRRLVKAKLLPLSRALRLIDRLVDEDEQASALGVLVGAVDEAEQREVLQRAMELSMGYRSQAMAWMMSELCGPLQDLALEELLAEGVILRRYSSIRLKDVLESLPAGSISKVLETVRPLSDPDQRVHLLLAIATWARVLSRDEQRSVLEECRTSTWAITDASKRIHYLCEMAAVAIDGAAESRESLLQSAWDVVRTLRSDRDKDTMESHLVILLDHLDGVTSATRTEIVDAAWRRIDDPKQGWLALRRFGPGLAKAGFASQVLARYEAVLPDESGRCMLLGSLLPYGGDLTDQIADRLQRSRLRYWALEQLATHLKFLSPARRAACIAGVLDLVIRSPRHANLLGTIATRMSPGDPDVHRLVATAHGLTDRASRARRLAECLRLVPAGDRGLLLEEILRDAEAITERVWRRQVLVQLVSATEADDKMLLSALALCRRNGDSSLLANAVVRLASMLAEAGHAEDAATLARRAAATFTRQPRWATEILIDVSRALPPGNARDDLWKRAIECAEVLPPDVVRAASLASLARNVPAELEQQHLSAVREAIDGLADPFQKTYAGIRLLDSLDPEARARAIGGILTNLSNGMSRGEIFTLIQELIPLLSDSERELYRDILDAINTRLLQHGEQPDGAARGSEAGRGLLDEFAYIDGLAPFLEVGQVRDVIGRTPPSSVSNLAALAVRLAESGHHQEAMAAVRKIESPDARSLGLALLLQHLPGGAHDEIIEEARRDLAIQGDRRQSAETESLIVPHLREPDRGRCLRTALVNACFMNSGERRRETMRRLAESAVRWLSPRDLEDAWGVLLQRIARQQRQEFAVDLVSLLPIVLRIGGPESIRVIGETFLDITDWFP